MNIAHIISSKKNIRAEIIGTSLIMALALFFVDSGKQSVGTDIHFTTKQSAQLVNTQQNVHTIYYKKNMEKLEQRFPFRKHNDPLAYINQVFIVFGGASLIVLSLMKKIRLQKSFKEVSGWDVSFVCFSLNLIFAYAFGFVAVVYDWWFFFPDLITKHVWVIQKGQMVLGDILFYPMATMMGYATILLVTRMKNPLRSEQLDTFLKVVWFMITISVILFGMTFGSMVTKGMISWLYIPFGIAGLLLYKRYTGFELWSVTGLFVLCEFAWDAVARIRGIWIFPDSSSHPGLYFEEICLCTIGRYPLIWQPEMTQMAFMSGMICLVFFHLSRYLLNREDIHSVGVGIGFEFTKKVSG